MKPILCAMNNPINSDPKYALYPVPRGCAGNRLYEMLREAGERVGREVNMLYYRECFDRRNVLSAKTWRTHEARREGSILRQQFFGRQVVVLGVQTLDALGLKRPSDVWGTWASFAGDLLSDSTQEIRYTLLPHPSGRCLEYNDPAMRQRTGDLLLGLYLPWLDYWEASRPSQEKV